MDILDFLNSKDVRKHLHSINYKPELLEAAYIVYRSRFKSVKEKNEAWQYLIDNTDDIVLDESVNSNWVKANGVNGMSAHQLLEEQIEGSSYNNERYSLKDDFWGMMWFDIPTPFKKGDIVFEAYLRGRDGSQCVSPFVLLDMEPWNVAKWERKGEVYKAPNKGRDSSGMAAWGYGAFVTCEINDCAGANYLDLEYYRKSYKGRERFLPLLAAMIKNEIDIYYYERAKQRIILEAELERSADELLRESNKIYGSIMNGVPVIQD